MSEALFDPTVKKKKKSVKTQPSFVEDDGSSNDGTPAAEVSNLSLGGEFDFKKKKKKSAAPKTAAADFDAQLQEAGVDTSIAGGEEASQPIIVEDVANSAVGEQYDRLLNRFFDILREQNPEMASDRSGIKYKIPPPIVQREGNKKTAFANITVIADKMHRPTEHVIHFLFTELGTSGSVDGTQRLVIKGRFQQKQIEGVLRRYILEYVTCKTCKSVNTRLTKENRLYFLDCNSCGSRRSVQSIKAGYQAVTRQQRKAAKAT